MDEVGENSAEALTSNVSKKTPKRGIVYLSTIPPYMNVTLIQEHFGQFGKIGRVFLQLADPEQKTEGKKKSSKRKVSKKFVEGWIEFERKSVAKKVASMLNNTQVSTRKKSKQYDSFWSIKYLPHFKWTHLHERLAYEKAARRQKLRAEIALAKKKTTYFTSNLDKKKNKQTVNSEFESLTKKDESGEEAVDENKPEDRTEFLESLFA